MKRHSIDLARLASLASRPGVDPRMWVMLARVVSDPVLDPNEGVFVDIEYIPTGEQDTAFVTSDYAGYGFGSYSPIERDDIVLVAIAGGDQGNGAFVFARFWRAADKPPTDLAGEGTAPTTDKYIRLKPGATYKMRTSGGGGVDVSVEGSGDIVLKVASGTVNLGASDLLPTTGVVNGEAIDTFTGLTQYTLGNASAVVKAKK